MDIRTATMEDADHLGPLAAELSTSFQVRDEAFRRSLAACLDDPACCVLVAEADGRIVGYLLGFDHLTFYANGRVSGVEEVYVEPDLRGRGIGQALMERFEAWARTRGAACVMVSTRRAAAFYRALGYEETATCFRRVLGPDPQETDNG
jgi:GNAT superfamily N-acetyltransferase